MDHKLVGGVNAALVTPFDENENLDLGAFRAVLEYVVGCGVNGIVVAGTTGEAHALTDDEREQLWRASVKWTRGRCPVIAGTSATSTRQSLRLQEVAADCGCDAALALPPWFENPVPEAIERFYADLADAAKIPLLLYHNPSRTKLDWPAEHLAGVARKLHGPVIGVKDSAHDLDRVKTIRRDAPEDFLIFAGWPHRRVAFEGAGANGTIDALASALPAEAVESWNGEEAKLIYFGLVYSHVNRSTNYIALLKHMMSEMDLPAGKSRRPFDYVPPAELKAAPELRYRGGAADEKPKWGFAESDVVKLLEPGLFEKSLESDPIAGLENASVYRAEGDDYCYNHHAQIFQFNDRYFIGWSAGWTNEDSPGQVVRYSVSSDGKTWSEPKEVMPPPEDRLRWTMGGFWELDGKLYLLAGRATRARYVDGEVEPGVLWENQWCELFEFTGEAWKPLGKLMEDFYPNEPPRKLPDGKWIVPGVSSRAFVIAYVGAGTSPDGWQRIDIATREDNYSIGGTKLTEPSWYSFENRMRMLLRDDAGSRCLLLTESEDGLNWISPVPTDFPDAQSKFRCVNLADGRVVVAGNPAPNDLKRRFLAVAVSEDGGASFQKLHKLRYDADAAPRHAGMHKVCGFSYPGVIEHDGRLWVVYAPNKEDIEVLSVPLGSL